MDSQVSHDCRSLHQLCRRLRAPDGCSWDRSQTIRSLTPYLLEETHELLEAIRSGEDPRLREELGDLLFLLLFVATIAEEEGRFTLAEVCSGSREKMIRRHPHVFAPEGEVPAVDARHAGQRWETVKAQEARAAGQRRGRLASGARHLPALLEAFRVQEKAASFGFDWPAAEAVLEKLDEERAELEQALRTPQPNAAHVRAEIGDLLFTLVNLARHLDADPEQLLRATSDRFRDRFRHMEARLTEEGTPLGEADLKTMERAWQRAKTLESGAADASTPPPETPAG